MGVVPVPGHVTLLLARLNGGDQAASAQLIPLVHKELRRFAGHYIRAERISHSLQRAALVLSGAGPR